MSQIYNIRHGNFVSRILQRAKFFKKRDLVPTRNSKKTSPWQIFKNRPTTKFCPNRVKNRAANAKIGPQNVKIALVIFLHHFPKMHKVASTPISALPGQPPPEIRVGDDDGAMKSQISALILMRF